MDQDTKQQKEDLAKPLPVLIPSEEEQILEMPPPPLPEGDNHDDFEEEYQNFDEYPFDLELDFSEHPDIRDEIEKEDSVRFLPWGF